MASRGAGYLARTTTNTKSGSALVDMRQRTLTEPSLQLRKMSVKDSLNY